MNKEQLEKKIAEYTQLQQQYLILSYKYEGAIEALNILLKELENPKKDE
jgi:hypothetical protein